MSKNKSKRNGGIVPRQHSFRTPKYYLVIVCEGEKTEPNYFQPYREYLKATANIKIEIQGTGYNTLSLVELAIRIKKEAACDSIWCVFDKDSFGSDFDNAIDKAKKRGIEIAYSNESFEIWYILHYQYHVSQNTRDQYLGILDRRLSEKYDKTSETMYQILQDKQSIAIQNAKKLEKFHDDAQHFSPSERNPSTHVYRLIEALNTLIYDAKSENTDTKSTL